MATNFARHPVGRCIPHSTRSNTRQIRIRRISTTHIRGMSRKNNINRSSTHRINTLRTRTHNITSKPGRLAHNLECHTFRRMRRMICCLVSLRICNFEMNNEALEARMRP